jgi:hypothetical protein
MCVHYFFYEFAGYVNDSCASHGGSFRCGASKRPYLVDLPIIPPYQAAGQNPVHIDIAGSWIIYPNMIKMKYVDRF